MKKKDKGRKKRGGVLLFLERGGKKRERECGEKAIRRECLNKE
jgi:hypothetical protein